MSSIRKDLLPQPGDVIADQYEVESLLGHGGMGAVFAGKHLRTGRAVAIKWMLPQAATSTEAVARFIAEAKATARIEHPNVVHIYDFGEDDGSPFLVMERLRGRSLREHLDQVKMMSPADAIRILVPAMRGVAEAHREVIIHRDIKPDNIFLCQGKDGAPREAKVVDFGISKLYDADSMSNLTGTGMMMGTPAYMSPEQLNAPKDADVRFDVYAFGVVMYEALTSRQPYQADGIFQLVAQIMSAEVIKPSLLAPGIPPLLDQVVLRAMHRDMPERFGSMREMIDAFEQVRPLLGVSALSSPGVPASPYGSTMAVGSGPVAAHLTPPYVIPSLGTPGLGIPMTQHATPPPRSHKTEMLTPDPQASQPGVQYHSQPGVQHPSQPGVQHHSQPGVQHHSQPGLASHSQPGFQHSQPGLATPLGTPHSPYGTQSGVMKKSGVGMIAVGAFALLLGGAAAGGAAYYLTGSTPSDPVATDTPATEPDPEPIPEPAAEPEPEPSTITSGLDAPEPEPAVTEPAATARHSSRSGHTRAEPEPVAEPEPEPERARPPRHRQPVPQPVVRPLGPAPTPRPATPRTQQGANGAMIIQ